MVRTRFAPSPTGFLHVGGVRTALYNYLFAKQQGGQFLLRLEDTDRERFVAEGVGQIIEALAWLGLAPDEGFWINAGQQQGIDYVQSQRHEQGYYRQPAEDLLRRGLAYYSRTSSQQLEELRQQAQAQRQPFIYRRAFEPEGQNDGEQPIRLDIAAVKKELLSDSISWSDQIRGDFSDALDKIEDFILIKSDGYPTYNFANVIDDHAMEISHVIRGDEFIASTSKHALLYELFGWERPLFIHLPPINGADGKKLSKRTGDTNALDYRDKGYLPDALLNFLALLGWNDGTTQEIFGRQALIEKFALERINSSPAVFDPQRLDWMNGAWIRQLSLDDLYDKCNLFWPPEAESCDNAYKKQVLGLVQERLKYLAELPALSRFFFVDLPVDGSLISNHKQLKKLSPDELRQLLRQTRDELEQSNFSATDLAERLNHLLGQTGRKPAVLFSLIRIATTQAPASPALAESLSVLGKERCLRRIDQQLAAL